MAWTTVSFSDPAFAGIADDTPATAANTGLEGLTNGVGTAQWATDSSGRRYITGNADGARITVVVADATTINASTEWVSEILLEYVGTAPDATQKTFLEVNSGGERLLVYHRTNSAWRQHIQLTVTDIGTLDDDPNTFVNPTDGDQLETGKRNWVGAYWKEDASNGMLGCTINGFPVHHYEQFDTSGMTDTTGLNTFTPMDGPSLNYRIYGYRYSTSGALSDLIVPIYEDETENAVRISKQYTEYIGPYELTGGPGTVSFETDSGGIISKLWRAKSAGGNTTLDLRSSHAIGQLRSSNGRACFGFTHFKAAASTVMDIRLTDTTSGDVGILTWRGDLGTAGARPWYLDGVDTGETGDETHSYIPVCIFDSQTNRSAILIFDMTEASTSAQHVFPIDWDRTGGIPEINGITITMYGADCYIGMPFHVPLIDSGGPSSWSATPRAATGGATTNIPNHITSAYDAFPNHGYYALGMMGFINWGRTGQLAAYTRPWWGNYSNAGRLNGLRTTYVDLCINDLNNGLSVETILSNYQAVVDDHVANEMRLVAVSNVLLPAGGSHAWDDDFRADQVAVAAGCKAIMIAANRPDLMYYAGVQESYASQAEMDALFTIATDDTHPNEAGRFDIAERSLSLLAPVGKFSSSESGVIRSGLSATLSSAATARAPIAR